MTAEPIELHWVQKPGRRIVGVRRPATLHQAAEMLAVDPGQRIVAGGTDIMPALAREGRGGEVTLVDLTAVADLRTLDIDPSADGVVVIGAGVTHNDILASPLVAKHVLPLAQACLEVGSPQLRNRATIAGNLVTASPANDTISALLALDATISFVSFEDGGVVTTETSIEDFFTGFRSTVLRPIDIVESITVRKLRPDQSGIWVKAGLRKAQAISVVHAGFVLDLAADGTVTDARIALGSVASTVVLSPAATDVLVGSSLSATTIAAAATAAADGVTPIDDGRASAAYRRESVATIVTRALTALAGRRERDRWPQRIPLLADRSRARTRQPNRATIDADTEISAVVNGRPVRSASAGTASLLDWLRENAGPGTKEGCAEGECGACTVELDGAAVMSCLVPAAQADGSEITTIEGLAPAGSVHPLQQSFVDRFAVQCGFCIPGFLMSASALHGEIESPTRDEIEFALAGNLCRCTGYYNIIEAVEAVASGTPVTIAGGRS